jgi:inhibitor of cysteine peptidase
MLELGERNDGSIAAARVGDVLTVRLPENASTGYRWAIDRVDPEKIELVEASGHYPASAAVGSGGDAIFRFKVKTAGESTIALKYWRQWEGDTSVIKRFTVSVMAVR